MLLHNQFLQTFHILLSRCVSFHSLDVIFYFSQLLLGFLAVRSCVEVRVIVHMILSFSHLIAIRRGFYWRICQCSCEKNQRNSCKECFHSGLTVERNQKPALENDWFSLRLQQWLIQRFQTKIFMFVNTIFGDLPSSFIANHVTPHFVRLWMRDIWTNSGWIH